MSSSPLDPAGPVTRFGRTFGRPRLLLAAPAALLATIVVWVAAAKVSTTPSTVPASPPPSVAAAPPRSPSASPMIRPTGPVNPVRLTGSLLLQGEGYRVLDLESGTLGPVLGPAGWRSRALRLPGGQFVCVCSVATGTQQLELRLQPIEADGALASGKLIGRWSAERDPFVLSSEQGDPVSSSAAVSPDGRFVAVGVSVRRDLTWRRSVALLDSSSAKVIDRLSLPNVPSNTVVAANPGAKPPATPRGGIAIHAWAPWITFSPDARTLLVSSSSNGASGTASQSSMTLSIGRGGFGRPVTIDGRDGFSTDICRDTSPTFGDPRTLFAICTDNGRSTVLRRVSIEGRALGDVDLSAEFKGSYPAQLLDPTRRTLFLWDPFGWTAVRVRLGDGTVEARAQVRRPTATLDPFASLARGLAQWVAPSATAKIWLEPALALSPDGSRLYVVAESGSGPEHAFETAAIVVLDARTLGEVDRWAKPGEVTSIAVSSDGRFVYTSGGPQIESSGTVALEAALAVRDAQSGAVVRIFEGLGGTPLLFPDRDMLLH